MNDFSLDNSIVTIRYKIVILGDVSVGKSSAILSCLEYSNFFKSWDEIIKFSSDILRIFSKSKFLISISSKMG